MCPQANKALRSQNVDLVQENMRLKAEVASRSPQKWVSGRDDAENEQSFWKFAGLYILYAGCVSFLVIATWDTISSVLFRFGRYTVAALEAKIQQYERNTEHLKKALERSDQYIEELESRLRKPESRCQEAPDVHWAGAAGAACEAGANSLSQQQRINMMMRSLSDSERSSICSNPEAEYQAFSRNAAPANDKELQRGHGVNHSDKNLDDASPVFSPATPSSAFRSLTLRSPGVREKKVVFKAASHLRRLNFDDFPSPEKNHGSPVAKTSCGPDKPPKCPPSKADSEASKSALWDAWPRSDSTSEPGPSGENSASRATSGPAAHQSHDEASMDAAYMDKISELDSMMLDGESCSSRGSRLSLGSCPSEDLDSTVVPDPQGCAHVSSSPSLDDSAHQDQHGAQEGPSGASAAEQRTKFGSEGAGVSSHTDELSFDLLFQPLDSGADPGAKPPNSSSCQPANAVKEKQATISQPTKRKSHSPFNTNSPTKLSKLMWGLSNKSCVTYQLGFVLFWFFFWSPGMTLCWIHGASEWFCEFDLGSFMDRPKEATCLSHCHFSPPLFSHRTRPMILKFVFSHWVTVWNMLEWMFFSTI